MISESESYATVSQMARKLQLSRSRFYQLIGTAFPEPSRDDRGRPYYNSEQQDICFDVRKRNCGIDGRPILFYAPRGSAPSPTRKRKPKKPTGQYQEVLEGVQGLGLANATSDQIESVIQQEFPTGIVNASLGEVIRKVFLSINRQNSFDNPV